MRRTISASRRQLDTVLRSSWDIIVRDVHCQPGDDTEHPLACFRARVRAALEQVNLTQGQQVCYHVTSGLEKADLSGKMCYLIARRTSRLTSCRALVVPDERAGQCALADHALTVHE